MKDYYRILEVDPEASPEVIRKAYQALSVKYHPDRFHSQSAAARSAIEARMRELNEAYEVLSDPASRNRHDRDRRRVQVLPPQDARQHSRLVRLAMGVLVGILIASLAGSFFKLLWLSPLTRWVLAALVGILLWRFYLSKRGRA